MKPLLIVTAALETATGLALLVSPPIVACVLLGPALDLPRGVIMARVAGAALLALGVACWLTREDGRALVAAMLVYNVAAVAILTHAGLGLGMSGTGLWPAVILHVTLAGWCMACLRPVNSSTIEPTQR
jgi:hypothetical protein